MRRKAKAHRKPSATRRDSCGIFGIRRRAVRKYGVGTWRRRCCWKFHWRWGGRMTANRSLRAMLVRIAEYLSPMDGLTARAWSAVITDGKFDGCGGQYVEIPSLTSQDKLKVEHFFLPVIIRAWRMTGTRSRGCLNQDMDWVCAKDRNYSSYFTARPTPRGVFAQGVRNYLKRRQIAFKRDQDGCNLLKTSWLAPFACEGEGAAFLSVAIPY